MVITYPLLTVVDDSGAIVSGATVAITSVKDKLGSDIASHGAVVRQSGANVAVDYDAETKGEGWIVLAISKVGSTFTNGNASPAFFLAKDSSRLLISLPNAAAAASGGLPTVGTSSGQINPSGGKVPATIATGDDVDGAAVKTTIGVAGAGLTALGDTRLLQLAHLATALQSDGAGGYQFTATALALAPTGSGSVTLGTGTLNSIADAVLSRDFTQVTSPASRSLLNAARFLRNRWRINNGILTVYAEDDSTQAWIRAVSTSASASPVIELQ